MCRRYIGSSVNIANRWRWHVSALRAGRHHSPFLQRAWKQYGEESFSWTVITECDENERIALEQYYLDLLQPEFNCSRRADAPPTRESVKHCPHGHEYTPENSYFNKKGEKICRACNRERVAAIYTNETPEQKAIRLAKGREYHQRNLAARREKQREYAARTKEQKRLYDIAYRASRKERRKAA